MTDKANKAVSARRSIHATTAKPENAPRANGLHTQRTHTSKSPVLARFSRRKADSQSDSFELRFDYRVPPLSANQRLHWRKRAAITADVRLATRLLASRIPHMLSASVELEWVVTSKRRRDVDNLVPTLKAMCDGLVDAGVVRDDTPDLMAKLMPTITLLATGKPHMLLRVTGQVAL